MIMSVYLCYVCYLLVHAFTCACGQMYTDRLFSTTYSYTSFSETDVNQTDSSAEYSIRLRLYTEEEEGEGGRLPEEEEDKTRQID